MLRNKIKLMDKYIIKEVAYPFVLGIFIITVILIGNYFFQLTDLIIVKKVPIYLVLKLLNYKLPSVMVETFPIAILFATMTGIGRLNRENEITAFRMGGISVFRLIIPLLIFGIIISGVIFILNEEIVPWSNNQANNIIRETIIKDSMPDLSEEVFFKGPKGRLFFVKDYDQKQGIIKNIIIYELKDKKFPEVITAEKGIVKENIWYLEQGIIHQYSDKGHMIFESRFNKMEIQLTDEMKRLYGSQKSTSEMSRKELKKRIDLFKNSGVSVDSLLVDYHLKLSEPFTVLIFILISVPLSLSNKESRVLNLVFTIIIVFLYYIIMSFSRSFGKNNVFSPLLAAWLPNLIFSVLGILLLFWRDSWQKIINYFFKILGFSMVLIFSILVFNPQLQAAEFKVNAEKLTYSPDEKMLLIEKNINGNYDKFFLKSDQIEIELKDSTKIDINKIDELQALPGVVSGCDLKDPHYYFDAERMIIKPGEYIKLYNIVFRELKGELPLFYWPYLYISLKDENSNFIPAFGYHETRGWFIKTKYFYKTAYDLPGNFYLDQYSISGAAGGIKQYFINQSKQKAYIYYYTQQNKTDLRGLFNWESELYHQAQLGNLDEEFSYLYQDYDDKVKIESDLDFIYSKNDLHSTLNLDYYDRNYLKSDYYDRKDYSLDFYYYNRFLEDLIFRFNYDKEYNDDAYYDLEEEFDRDLYLRYSPGNGWLTKFNYYDGEITREDKPKKSRQGGEFSIEKRLGDYKFNFLLERYSPRLIEEKEEEIEFSRLPEISLEYNPRGKLSYFYQLGKYYEKESLTEGLRGRAEIEYSDSYYLPFNNYLRIIETLSSSIYKIDNRKYNYIPNQQTSETKFKLRSKIFNYLTIYNEYTYVDFRNISPFEFDRSERENLIENRFNYRINPHLNFDLETGYDFQETEYLDLDLYLSLYPSKNWKFSLGTSYDLNKNLFNDDLIIKNNYQGQKWEHHLGIEYDLNENRLREIDNKLIYELDTDYGLYFESNLSIDNDYYDKIREANIQLKKKFHCRELAFSYDYIREEFTVQYSLELFPADSIAFTKNREDLIFDSSIEERLKDGEF